MGYNEVFKYLLSLQQSDPENQPSWEGSKFLPVCRLQRDIVSTCFWRIMMIMPCSSSPATRLRVMSAGDINNELMLKCFQTWNSEPAASWASWIVLQKGCESWTSSIWWPPIEEPLDATKHGIAITAFRLGARVFSVLGSSILKPWSSPLLA